MNHACAVLIVLSSSAAAGCYDRTFELEPPPHSERITEAHEGPEAAPQFVLTSHVENARDLGGTPLHLARSAVAYGELFRGPPLANLSTDGCDEFARLGIRSVIDLRIEDERFGIPDAACIQQTASLVEAPLPVPYNVSPADYIADLDAADSIAAAFRVLGDPASYPVYVHCTYGRDRTGVLVAVILSALGASREAILDEYLLSEPIVGASPPSLEATLDEIEARGGIEAYLTAMGVTPTEVANLRARAVAKQN